MNQGGRIAYACLMPWSYVHVVVVLITMQYYTNSFGSQTIIIGHSSFKKMNGPVCDLWLLCTVNIGTYFMGT